MDGSALPETRSTCPYCGVGCGVLLRPDGKGGLDVRGDPDHPANLGRLCSKGLALGETVGHEDRLITPLLNGIEASWDDSLQLVADRFSDAIAEYGPDSVAFYVSGQLLTEDYYVANKLMKGFIGSANIDTNSRLCMASTVAGHRRAFGEDVVPGTYEDLDEADLVVLVGSNLAWCHPVLYQRVIAARKKRGTRIVVVDPRRTASCDQADLHLAIAPGADVALFNRLLTRIAAADAVDPAMVGATVGFDEALQAATADQNAPTGLSDDEIEAFCRLWIETDRVVTVFSQGVNQSTSGTDKVNSILNCHLAAGRIGKLGCGPFSVTGQPNAMGGREVGGLANTLASHLDIEDARHRQAVQGFWNSQTIAHRPGLKAVDLFRAVGDGRIKALWIIHSNPAVTLPEANAVRDGIASCPFTVVSDITKRADTAQLADVLLPASAWAEKDGTVTNSDRTISRQRGVLPAPGAARADWDILAEVGRRMGWEEAFDYHHAGEIFREHAALSAIGSRFGRAFDLSTLSNMSEREYEEMSPTRWPVGEKRQGGRFFGDGAFLHTDGKARMVAVSWKPPAARMSPRYPFRLNTGRIRDQWHTMTRTGLSARLSAHLAEPFLDIHPDDADDLGVEAADLVKVESPASEAVLRARLTDAVGRSQVFAPIHWTAETAPSARIDSVVSSATDPISGQPESKASVVKVSRFNAAWYGFAVSVDRMSPTSEYWAQVRMQAGYRTELAGLEEVADWGSAAQQLFGLFGKTASSVEDRVNGTARVVFEEEGRLLAALYVSRRPVSLMRDYVATLPGKRNVAALGGRAPTTVVDPGPVVCSCFGVGANTIARAIVSQGLCDVNDVGVAVQAGTNCGSCRPEIANLITRIQQREAAE